MVPITGPWHKGFDVWVRRLRRDGWMDRMVFDTLNSLLFLHRIGFYSFGTCIDVDNVVAVVRGFGHEGINRVMKIGSRRYWIFPVVKSAT